MPTAREQGARSFGVTTGLASSTLSPERLEGPDVHRDALLGLDVYVQLTVIVAMESIPTIGCLRSGVFASLFFGRPTLTPSPFGVGVNLDVAVAGFNGVSGVVYGFCLPGGCIGLSGALTIANPGYISLVVAGLSARSDDVRRYR